MKSTSEKKGGTCKIGTTGTGIGGAKGRPTTGTLTSVTDGEGNKVQYEYELYGNLTKLTNERGKHTRFGYDYQGREMVTTNPLGLARRVEYDDAAGCSTCRRFSTLPGISSVRI